MTNQKPNLFINIMTSGKSPDGADEAQMDMTIRYILLNSMIFLGSALLFLFSYQSFRVGAALQGAFDLAMGITTLVAFVLLRTRTPFLVSGYLTVIAFMFLCGFLARSGGVQGSGVLWVYSFPLLAIFILGMRPGTILSALLGAFTGLSVLVPGFAAIAFERSFALRTVGVYILVLACTLVYEKTKIEKDRRLAALNRSLKSERDEIAAMKDNLKDGLFLMDRDLTIQGQYSRSMEQILGTDQLQSRSLLDILSNSIQQKESDTLKDYFGMVAKRAFDAQMLEDINPLHEFQYTSTAEAEPKTLRCSFAAIDRENGETYILGTVQDRTREAELERQLEAEERKRQEDMRALFEVIHVDPRVMQDFLEDGAYEFQRINEILKDAEKDSPTAMVEIYQSVHAVKSNAAILGLSDFAAALHELERELALLREKPAVPLQDMIHIMVRMEKILRMNDKFKDLLDKIRSFQFGSGRMQEEYVLVQTLERVVEKTTRDLGKKARLTVERLDPAAIHDSRRRIIKEVLVQLVRNAVYHGIEEPEERVRLGKEETGEIRLNIGAGEGKLLLQLSDNGAGIRFDRIREKARMLGLITNEEQLQDKSMLLKAIFLPGFSTAAEADLHAGRGMGLSLVRDRIKELQGTVKIQSEQGKGTVFRVQIPLEEAAPETKAETTASA